MDYKKHCKLLQFGEYCQVFDGTTNTMQRRTSGAIALCPTGNGQRGHYFYSLRTGKRINRIKYTTLSMPDKVITRIEKMSCREIPGLAFMYRNLAIVDDDDDHSSGSDGHTSSNESSNDDDDYDPYGDINNEGRSNLNDGSDDKSDVPPPLVLGYSSSKDNSNSDSDSNSDNDPDSDNGSDAKEIGPSVKSTVVDTRYATGTPSGDEVKNTTVDNHNNDDDYDDELDGHSPLVLGYSSSDDDSDSEENTPYSTTTNNSSVNRKHRSAVCDNNREGGDMNIHDSDQRREPYFMCLRPRRRPNFEYLQWKGQLISSTRDYVRARSNHPNRGIS